MRKALVPGGAGFIGSHLVRRLLASGWTVRVLDDLSSGHRHNLEEVWPEFEFIEGDIRDAQTIGRACAGVEMR